MSIKENRPLILRSNRFFGSKLVEIELISSDDLEAANEKLLEIIQSGNLKTANLLNILIYDLNLLNENELINRTLEEHPIGLIELSNYDLSVTQQMDLDPEICQVTYTLPFDMIDDYVNIATSFYLSKPARDYWEDKFKNFHILWYISTMNSISETLDRYNNDSKTEES